MEPLNVLAIDGGGVRGVVAAGVLDHVERQLQRPVRDSFQLIAATSAGALVGAMLAQPAADGGWRSAADVVQEFLQHAARIFPDHPLRGGPLRPLPYSASPLRAVAQSLLGARRLSDCAVHLVVPVWDLANACTYAFDSQKAKQSTAHDYDIADVLAAAVAAPYYFAPHPQIADANHPRSRLLIDGGIYANNPALVGLVKARERFPDRPIRLLSVGTGAHRALVPVKSSFSWNDPRRPVRRLTELIETVFDATSDGATDVAAALLGDAFCRVQPDLPRSLDRLDDSRQSTLVSLLQQVAPALRSDRVTRFIQSLA